MTEERFNISRRKALGALGTIGVASAGAGLGTSAYFSDQETFENNQLTAGTLDMKVDWEEHYYDGSAGADLVTMSDPGADTSPIVDLGTGTVGAEGENITLYPSGDATKDEFWDATSVEALPDSDDDGIQDPVTDPCGENSNLVDVGDEDSGLSSQYRTEDSVGEPLIALDDVKPGDFGEVTFSTHLCTNPGYLWMTGDLVEARENGVTEPEAEDADENGATDEVIEDVSGISGGNVELLDQIQVRVWYDDDCDNQKDGNEMEEWSGNLGEFLIDASPDAASSASADDRGIPLDGTRTYEGGLGGYDDFVRLGVNHLDLSDDGDSDVVFEDATDPAGTSEQVVYGHSVGGSSQDYATTVAALPDVTLQDIADGATLTYDYYHGPAHGHAAPDEVWLLLEHPDGTRTTVRRTSNDDNPVSGSARTPKAGTRATSTTKFSATPTSTAATTGSTRTARSLAETRKISRRNTIRLRRSSASASASVAPVAQSRTSTTATSPTTATTSRSRRRTGRAAASPVRRPTASASSGGFRSTTATRSRAIRSRSTSASTPSSAATTTAPGWPRRRRRRRQRLNRRGRRSSRTAPERPRPIRTRRRAPRRRRFDSAGGFPRDGEREQWHTTT
ncbi:SipW-dependent-type signal peptide-containing protein [Haloplanus sp. GCM10025708]|uniref:SipW-dependent-type signal peptide-containing protein n=1 Tax=Haloplanus sp. GCM10025708 TaxID=3252679 RepID=UPI00360E3412